MFAEIITIGDELLIGQVVDTNSAWIGHELNNVGVEVLRVTSVRDRQNEIVDALESAMKRVDLVIVTGGLGPTKDDITKKVLCDYFDTKLIFNDAVYANIKRILGNRISMNDLNKSQAMVPEKCTVINNRVGTAPICWFEANNKILVSLPGVPQEMTTVMSEEILPRLKNMASLGNIIHRTFLVKNLPESILAEKIASWEGQLPDSIKLAYLPKLGIVLLRLTARGTDENVLSDLLNEESLKLKSILGKDLLIDSDSPLEIILGDKLKNLGLSIATAESCTGGSIAARITSIPGCSEYYKGGIVAYSNQVKIDLLEVSPAILSAKGAVSEETVIAMAKGAMKQLNVDCAIATSGIAGPDGGTVDKPVGTIWIAACYKEKQLTLKQEINRGRAMNVERAANNALLLMLELLEIGKN